MTSQRETPLADAAAAFFADRRIRRSRHRGTSARPSSPTRCLALDLPLSAGADDLHLRPDVLGRAERLAAELWGADLLPLLPQRLHAGQPGSCARGRAAGAIASSSPATSTSRSSWASSSRGSSPSGCDPTLDDETGLPLAVAGRAGRGRPRRIPSARAVFLVEPTLRRRAERCACDRGRLPAARRSARRRPGLGSAPRLPPGAAAHALALGADADGRRPRTRRSPRSPRARTSSRAEACSTSSGWRSPSTAAYDERRRPRSWQASTGPAR